MLELEWDLNKQECLNHKAYNEAICISEEHDRVLSITKSIDSIDPNRDSFKSLTLNFSPDDLLAINNINSEQHDYYGATGTLKALEHDIAHFIDIHTNNEKSFLGKNILKNIEFLLKASGHEYMNIKITMGDSDKCWHIDKSFDEVTNKLHHESYESYSHSFIFTLKGAATQFLPTSHEIRKNFHLKAEEYDFTYEIADIDSIANSSSIVDARSAVFIRSSQYGCIHSAPEGKARVVFVISPLIQKSANFLNEYFKK